MGYTLALLCSALLAAASHDKRAGYAVKSEHKPASQWIKTSRAPANQIINLRIALKQQSFDELESRLLAAADPDDPSYGDWLQTAEIHELITPHEDTTSAVRGWLAEHNITSNFPTSPAGDWFYVALPIEKAEHLLDTQYHVYEHAETGEQITRTPQYGLPLALHEHIDMIAPTNYFGSIKPLKSSVRVLDDFREPRAIAQSLVPPYPKYGKSANLSAVCNATAVTNLCLRTLYKTVDYVPQVPEKNLVSMTAYLNETANITDFHIFLSRYRTDASQSYTFDVTSINGGINHQTLEPPEYLGARDVEAGLDSQTIGGFIYPTPFEVYSTGGSPPFVPDLNTPTDTNEPYLDWLNYMLSLPKSKLPNTVSTSYGDDEQTVPYDYAIRTCQEMAQLTSKGVTLFFSSGDNGVGTNGTCFSNDGKNTTEFLPAFPASCPYVTAVGGTRNFQPEIVAYDVRNGYVSGSGVSNYFGRPAWQNAAFTSYKQNVLGDLHAGLYNTTGRAYPDIAAQGFAYLIVYNNRSVRVDGTSASSPTATSVLSLVNDALIKAGRGPLGFINPWLYKYGHYAFTDIEYGNTWGCNTSGFPAAKGWDLASGWGTPDFSKLVPVALFGPPPSVFS